PYLRRGSRDRRHDRGGSPVRPGCADRAGRWAGHPGDALRRIARALLHRAQPRPPVPSHARPRPRLTGRPTASARTTEKPPGLRPRGPERVSTAGGPGSDNRWDVGQRDPGPGAKRSGLREVLVVAGVVLAVSVLGALTGASEALQPLLTGTSVGHDILGGVIVLLCGIAVLAVRQTRTAREEATLRHASDEQLRALISESPVVSFTWLPQ